MCLSFSMIFSILAILQVLHCAFPIFHFFQCFSPYSRAYIMCLIFHDFQFSHNTSGVTVCIFYFPCAFLSFYVFSVFCLIPDSIVSISHFLRFSMFLAIFQILYRALLIFQVFFSFSHHIPVHTVFVYHFLRFSVFSP